MKKSIIAAVLLLCWGLLLSGCGNSLEPQKEVTLTIKVPAIRLVPKFDPDMHTSYDFILKAANDFAANYKDAKVTVNVVEFDGTAYATEVDGCFDTPGATDVLYGDFFNTESYVYTGRVVPLDDIITDEIRADIDSVFWPMCQQNGKTYMMPFLYRQNVLGYNKDLFRSCGLEKYCSNENEVQTWTLDEWAEILATLKARLPANKYPLMLYAMSNQGDTHIMTFIRSQGSRFFSADGYFNLNTPEGIAGLTWLKYIYDQGYVPKHAEKLEIHDNHDMFINGQLALYIVNDATESIYDFDCGFVNFPAANGGLSTNFNTGFEVFDNCDPAKLAAAKAFVKYIYESDWLDYSAGSIPCSKRIAAKYAADLTGVQKYLANANTGVHFTGGNPNWTGVRQVFHTIIRKLLTGEYAPAEAAAALDSECNAAIRAGYENSKLHE